jgi:CSLREA domain-containing protein
LLTLGAPGDAGAASSKPAAAPADPAAAQLATSGVTVSAPTHAQRDRLTAVVVGLPANVAAVEGRLLASRKTAELMGVVPAKGNALRPASVKGGYAFAAYNMAAVNGHNAIQLVVLPHRAGRLQVRIVIDSAADRSGHRLTLGGSATSTLPTRNHRKTSSTFYAAPDLASVPAMTPRFAATPVHRLIGRGTKITRMDLDQVRYGWTTEQARNASCSGQPAGDINSDGCVDAVDLQATVAALVAEGKSSAVDPGAKRTVKLHRNAITPIPGRTFTVNSALDTPDATLGDGVCATAAGVCTLRAAIQEADWDVGDDRIEFNIPGTGMPIIRLTSGLPLITSLQGTLTIDGYTQPGARVNSAGTLDNAQPGVEIRGNGGSANEFGFYITSGGNTIRGIAIGNIFTAFMLDGANATLNRIVGDWIGFSALGGNAGGIHGILVNTGANNNIIGTPDLADRDVFGSWDAAIDEYGAGTDYNVIQNNVFCIQPNGGIAQCRIGVDHNFGPKNDLIGGSDPNDLNVFGPTRSQAVEYSHGWDQTLPWGTDTKITYQINNNRLIGNWMGFRGDGSPDPTYASGLVGGGNDGQAVNVIDGSNYTLVKDNYMASAMDGVQIEAPNAKYNEVRNNIMGVAPNGQPAAIGHWGVRLQWQATREIVEGNTIRNAGWGGIGMTMNTVYNTRLSQNIITDTTGPAILATFDAASGTTADMGVPAPVITTATTDKIQGTAIVSAEVEVYKATRPADGTSSGLPAVYLGTVFADANGNWTLPVTTLSGGDSVTALQIRPDQNTSVLAVNAPVTAPPPPDPRIAADAFARTTTNGWGAADVGGTWSVSDAPANYAVQNGAASMTTTKGVARNALLGVNVADASITGTVRFSIVPNTGNEYAYVEARRVGTDGYRGAIRVASNGAVFVQLRKTVGGVETGVGAEVSTSLNVQTNTTLAFRFTVSGSHLQLRVWDATAVEPTTWQTEADDTSFAGKGSVGVRGYLGGPVTNGPATLTFGNFLATKP